MSPSTWNIVQSEKDSCCRLSKGGVSGGDRFQQRKSHGTVAKQCQGSGSVTRWPLADWPNGHVLTPNQIASSEDWGWWPGGVNPLAVWPPLLAPSGSRTAPGEMLAGTARSGLRSGGGLRLRTPRTNGAPSAGEALEPVKLLPLPDQPPRGEKRSGEPALSDRFVSSLPVDSSWDRLPACHSSGQAGSLSHENGQQTSERLS